MKSKVEKRVSLKSKLSFRQMEEGEPVIEGYAAVFNRNSEVLPGNFVEVIRPGAFTKSLEEEADVRALIDHDPTKIIGRSKAGTLMLEEDRVGLRAEIIPAQTTQGKDIVESVRRGDIDGMSFGFITLQEEWTQEAGEEVAVRELVEVDLVDVSVVTFPAYPDTTVAVRSLGRFKIKNGHDPAKLDAMKKMLDAADARQRLDLTPKAAKYK